MGLIRQLALILVAAIGIAALGHSGFVIAQQIIYGRAGAPSANVVTVQGITGETPVSVTMAGGLATGGATQYHINGGSANTTNATSIVTGAHTLKSLSVINIQASTIGYLRFYDVSGSPTCSSSTNAQNSIPVIPGPGGVAVPLPPEGWKFANGISFCITGGGGDSDNTNAPTGIFVIASYD